MSDAMIALEAMLIRLESLLEMQQHAIADGNKEVALSINMEARELLQEIRGKE